MSNGEQFPEDLEDLVGRTLGERYVLDKFIDRGGYGAVYLGTDTRLKQPVAVKVGLSTREFMKEARLAAEVKHNHIVQVMDYGSDAGFAYLVMEYLHGEDLEKLFNKQGQSLTKEQLRKLVYEVGDALACAHADKLIHRDLKPRNIILREHFTKSGMTTGNKKFVLLDFGIAAKLDTEGTLKNKTQAGAGTVEYMPPELLGRNPTATPQSDIYSFGVILYQMLMGRVPFPQEDMSQMALASCFIAISKSPPPRFRDTAPARKCSAEVETLVLQCLEKDPALRPQSMDEVRDRFIKLIDDELTSEQRRPIPVPKTRSTPWLLILITILLAVALGYTLFQQFTAPPVPEASPNVVSPPVRDLSPPIEAPKPSEPPASVLSSLVFEAPSEQYVASGESVSFEVSCPKIPEGMKLIVVPDEKLPSGIEFASSTGKPDYSSCKLTLRTDSETDPIAHTIRLSAKIQQTEQVLYERPLPLTLKVIWRPRDYEVIDPKEWTLDEGNYFYKRLKRVVGAPVEFLLIAKPKGCGDPGTFYMMKNKVSRELFDVFLKEKPNALKKGRAEEIHKGWRERGGTPKWPVTHTTVVEAHQFAIWIGGSAPRAHLPMPNQWKRASGADFEKPASGCIPPSEWDPKVWRKGPYKEGSSEKDYSGLALEDFADVGSSPNDVTVYGCRDMAGNGYEILGQASTRPSTVAELFKLPNEDTQNITISMFGKPVGRKKPFQFEDFVKSSPLAQYDKPNDAASFRVVIER